jgi:putative endonuclease
VRQFFVYIMASKSRRLYVGVTNNLERRTFQHVHGWSDFTSRYRINRLVYYECHRHPMTAIYREKQIKGWSRAKRMALVETMNPTWKDLAVGWFQSP